MKRRLAKILFLLGLAAFAVGWGVHWLNREPSHEGRPLSEWVRDLRDNQPETRARALKALRAMGDDAVPYLAETIGKDETLLERVNRRLGSYVPGRVRRAVARAFGLDRMMTRKIEAAHALQTLGTNAQESIPALVKLLRDSNALLSSMASSTLAKMGPAAVPELIRALDEGDLHVRMNACAALRTLGTNSAPAAPRLASILASETGPIVSSASYTLSRIGLAAMPVVAPILSHTNWVARKWAAYAMTFMYPPGVKWVEELYPLTQDEHPEARLAAVNALGHLRVASPATAALLRERFNDPDERVRSAAIKAFGNMPSLVRRHMEDCIALLDDSSPQVRGRAAEALAMVAPSSRLAAAQLEKLASDEDPFARKQARHALKVISESEKLEQGRR